MTTHAIHDLAHLGQSLWYDQLSRSLVADGTLKRLIDQDGLRGMTSNPTIFEKAMTSGPEYAAPLAALARKGLSAYGIYEQLAVEDVGAAADVFRPLYDATSGLDGYVSIEVNPKLAHDTEGTIEEGRRLFAHLGRPNIMIKVPATDAGLPAIRTLIAEGVNVNVTLIFAVSVYHQVVDAYISGLEKRVAARQPVDHIASVASFFVSRIDSTIDSLLESAAAVSGERDRVLALRGRAAVANARLAYQAFLERFRTDAFRAIGARVQRPLWASTGTKNPAYSDVLYVDELVGADTVNTVPPQTFDAFRDHGRAGLTIEKDVAGARRLFVELRACGIEIDRVTDQLTRDGVKSFASSLDTLLAVLEKRRSEATS